jgi:hypothetical protein
MNKGYLRNVVNEAYVNQTGTAAEAVVSKLMDMHGDENGVQVMLNVLITLEKNVPEAKAMLEGILKTLKQGRKS